MNTNFNIIYKFKGLKCVGLTLTALRLPKNFKVHPAFTRNESWFLQVLNND